MDSLEALLAECTNQLQMSTKENELLRKQITEQNIFINSKFLKLESAVAELHDSSQSSAAIKKCKLASVVSEPKIKNCRNVASKIITESNSPQPHALPSSIANNISVNRSVVQYDGCEIIMSNIIKDCNFDHKRTARAVIKSILPSITAEDIVSCRLAARREKGSSDITSNTRPPPIFVKLRSSSLVQDIIAAKKQLNLLHTSDLEPSSLSELEPSKIIATLYVY